MKKTKIIHPIIILCFMLLFGMIPPIGELTQFGMQVLGVFIGCIYAWSMGIIMWPTLLAFIILASYQNITILTVIQQGCGDQNLWICVWAMIFCYVINQTGLVTIIGKWIISRKIARRGPFWLIFIFWLACWFVCMLTITSFPIVILLWSIFYEIMDQVGIKKYSKYANVLMIGLAIFSYLGDNVFPFSPWPVIINSLFVSMGATETVSFGSYLVFTLIVSAVYFVVAMIVTKYIIRPKADFDISKVKIKSSDLKLTKPQKIVLVMIFGMIIFLLFPGFLPDNWLVVKWLNNMSVAGCFMIIVIIASFIRKDDNSGEKVFNVADAVKNGVDWQSFFMLAMCYYVANLLVADSTGIMTQLKIMLDPVLSGRSAIVTILLFAIIGAIITNCLNNMVTASLMTPIAIAFAATNGINLEIIVVIFSVILMQGCVLPSGSAMGAVLHSNVAYLKAKDIYIYAAIYTLLLAVVVGFVGVVLNNVLF